LAVFVGLLYIDNKNRKQRLTKRAMLFVVSESISAVYLLLTSLNILYQWVTEATAPGYPFKLPNNSLVMAFCFLVLFLDTFNKRLKKPLHRSKRTQPKGAAPPAILILCCADIFMQQKNADIPETMDRSWQSSKEKEAQPWRKPLDYSKVYYSNLDELRKIIVQNENWAHKFQPYFGRPEGVLAD
jgi:hypothetical protein